jgi:hypothetical protein
MNHLYNIQTRYDVVHVELGPVFMVVLHYLLNLWTDLRAVCREQACARVLVEGRNPLRDMRTTEAKVRGDFLCGLEQRDVRVTFCLYNYPLDGLLDEFESAASAGQCRLTRFERVEDAVSWVGLQ